MGLVLHYNSNCQTIPMRVIDLNITLTATIWSLELENSRNLLKEINRFAKVYKNIERTPAILGNETLILLYSKVPRQTRPEETHLNVSQTKIIWSLELKNTVSLKEINRI